MIHIEVISLGLVRYFSFRKEGIQEDLTDKTWLRLGEALEHGVGKTWGQRLRWSECRLVEPLDVVSE